MICLTSDFAKPLKCVWIAKLARTDVSKETATTSFQTSENDFSSLPQRKLLSHISQFLFSNPRSNLFSVNIFPIPFLILARCVLIFGFRFPPNATQKGRAIAVLLYRHKNSPLAVSIIQPIATDLWLILLFCTFLTRFPRNPNNTFFASCFQSNLKKLKYHLQRGTVSYVKHYKHCCSKTAPGSHTEAKIFISTKWRGVMCDSKNETPAVHSSGESLLWLQVIRRNNVV